MKMSDAIKLVMKATKYARGGEIFILKMKAFKLSDLVDVLINNIAPKLGIKNDEIKVNVVGLFSGEKLHENLINEIELTNIYDLGDIYMIGPKKFYNSKIIKENLTLSSKDAELISKKELLKIIEEYLIKNEQIDFKIF